MSVAATTRGDDGGDDHEYVLQRRHVLLLWHAAALLTATAAAGFGALIGHRVTGRYRSGAVGAVDGLPLSWIIVALMVSTVAITERAITASLRRRGHLLRSVAVIGEASTHGFSGLIESRPECGYRVVTRVPDLSDGLGCSAELAARVGNTRLDDVVIASPCFPRAGLFTLVAQPCASRARFHALAPIPGLAPDKVRAGTLAGHPVFHLLGDPLPPARRLAKRAIDLVLASVTVVVLAPLMLVAAAAIRLTSSGPILFRQRRIGIDGRPFSMFKFRTMVHDAAPGVHERYVEELLALGSQCEQGSGNLFKLTDDPRVTRVGAVLRCLSIDELPQLINVLRGEMSLVGPRPGLEVEVARYDDWQRRRLDVLPGMTGLWQVSGRNRLTFEDMFRLDVEYVATWSLLSDIRILWRTAAAVLRRECA